MQQKSVIMKSFLLSILTLALLFTNIKSDDVKMNSEQGEQDTQIYGVRWFVGDRFSYAHRNSQSPNYYTLCFNSNDQFSKDVYVEISGTISACSHRKIQVKNYEGSDDSENIQNVTTTAVDLYHCYISQNLWQIKLKQLSKQESYDQGVFHKIEVDYEIYITKPIFSFKDKNHNINDAIVDRDVSQRKISLYSGIFRPVPTNNDVPVKFFSLGDWAQVDQNSDVIQILPALISQLENDPSIVMVLFLGDIAYDFMGQKYFSMIDYIQPLTSKICFMVTPGNHDFGHHQDAFELFIETFMSPQWNLYYLFYYTMIIGDLFFLQYSPEDLIYSKNYKLSVSPIQHIIPDMYHNKTVNGSSELVVDPISSRYYVIPFSHYPFYCSQNADKLKSCTQNQNKLSKYMKVFKDIGMDLYLSGHEHYYERTHQICLQKIDNSKNDVDHQVIFPKQDNNEESGDIYDKDCPIYIVDGAAGNPYFMDPQSQIVPKRYTAGTSFGSGYGLLSFSPSNQNTISYTHYKMIAPGKTKIADKFTKILQPLPDSPSVSANNQDSIKDLEIFFVIMLVVLISVFCICIKFGLYCKKQEGGDMRDQHIQMVEENFHTIRSSSQDDKAANKKKQQQSLNS